MICGTIVYFLSHYLFDMTCDLSPDLRIFDAHNLPTGDTMRQRIKFTDERVCKSHLLESCPHDILSGTVSVSIIVSVVMTLLI